MKLLSVFLFGTCLSLHAGVFAQRANVSLDVKEASLNEVLQEISRQTQCDILYNLNFIKQMTVKDVKVANKDFLEVLDDLLPRYGLTYSYDRNVVVIRAKEQKPEKKEIKITGLVTDMKNNPLPGVTILLKGTGLGTATDVYGEFALNVVPGVDTLIISYIGMKPQVLVLTKGKTEYVIRMQEAFETLDDIVVTGYGNVSKRNYTGAVTTVRGEDVMTAGASTIDQMLQGIVPGMMVQTRSGMVGASPKIRVRGTSTLLGSQEPVWVVDGVIQRNPQPFNADDNTKFSMDADDISKLAGNAISWLNPYDIETITVLKDASATAIYGSQAANGVIVITTKKAKPGRLNISYNGDVSIGQRPRYGLYDRMNSAEMMQFSKEMYEERVSYPTVVLPIGYAGLVQKLIKKEITPEEMNREYLIMARENTDWFDLLFRNSFNHKHSLSIGGGSEKVTNRTSFSVDQQKGEAVGNDLSGISVISSTDIRLGDNFRVSWSLNGSMRKVKGFAYGMDPFSYAYNTTRVLPVRKEDGALFYHNRFGQNTHANGDEGNDYKYNILNERNNTGSRSDTKTWGTTLDVSWELLPGLQYQGVFSYNTSSLNTKEYATERSFYITQFRGYEFGTVLPGSREQLASRIPYGGILSTATTNEETVTVRNSLNYDKMFDRHMVVFSVGVETNSSTTTGENHLRYGYLKERGETFAPLPAVSYTFGNLDSPVDNREYAYGTAKVLNRKNNLFSTYLQGVYAFDDRYVLNISARVDASNRFGQDKNKRFAPTWSAGVKWNLGNEYFLSEQYWLNSFDVTLAYGYQGNAVEGVSPFLIAEDGGIDDYYKTYVLKIKSLSYPNLGWEKTKSYNIGVNASFLDGRVSAGFNYYLKDSEVLSSRDVPYENGMQNCIVSGSKMRNSGYDFVVDVMPIKTDNFSWHISVNSGSAKNEVRRNERINTLEDYLLGSAVVPGEAFSTFYSFKFKGINDKNGTPLFANIDQEQAESPLAYLVKSGKFTPDFSGGLNTMFKYRNWTLYALFSVQWGGYNRLPALYDTDNNHGVPTPEQNLSRKLLKRWRQPGDQTIYPSIPGVGDVSVRLPSEMEISTYISRNPYALYNQSDIRVARTDMIRCNSLSLGYDFTPEILEKLHVSYLSLKATLMNPFMWVRDKKWEGIDPETANWPARRVTSLSLQVAF